MVFEVQSQKKKISYHSRRGWICGDVNSWLTASTWSPQAWLTLSYFFISLCLLRTFVAWWPETPPPLRTPQSPADGRPGSRSLSRAVASSMKLYRTCHLRVIIIYYLGQVNLVTPHISWTRPEKNIASDCIILHSWRDWTPQMPVLPWNGYYMPFIAIYRFQTIATHGSGEVASMTMRS